jgi:thiamine-monophosphate kinase
VGCPSVPTGTCPSALGVCEWDLANPIRRSACYSLEYFRFPLGMLSGWQDSEYWQYLTDMPLPERELIRKIRKMSGLSRSIAVGIGDDAAIVRPAAGHELLVTTDLCLEGVHFRRDWSSAGQIGAKCLTRGLSDIAAMGGEPLACFLSLALPKQIPQKWVDGFLRGFTELGKKFACPLAGGDIAQSPSHKGKAGVLADVTVIGSVPRGQAVLRSGAKPGDTIYVTGALGGAAAELQKFMTPQIKADMRRSSRETRYQKRETRLPLPRLHIGTRLRATASSMLDISDGLSVDLAHICEESGVGAVVNELLVPLARGANLQHALHGGEDYELLFTAPSRKKIPVQIAGVQITEIGWIEKGNGVRITDMRSKPRKLEQKGWQHFSK